MKRKHVIEVTHKPMRRFEYIFYSAFSSALLFVLVLLPVAPVFASETIEENPASVEMSESPIEEEVRDTDENDVETEIEAVDLQTGPVLLNGDESDVSLQNSTSANDPSDSIIIDTEGDMDTSSESEIVSTEGELDHIETIGSTSTSDSGEEDYGSSAETESEDVPTDEEPNDENLVTDDDTLQDGGEHDVGDVSDDVASSSDENVIVVNTLTNDENRFSFSKDECTVAGDGVFYCTKKSAIAEVSHTDRIFSAVDSEGDKEIFVEKGDALIQLTKNSYDDDMPYFDESSNTVVWHRLLEGRYQIMSYDFSKSEESQITFDRFNNMQPTRFGDTTVWQGWVGDDWEIFLLKNNELTMLTDNTVHDITPSINGTHVVWQSFEGGSWQMKVYDIRTQTINTVKDTEGGSIENPRFVLVYDAKLETGDVETRGYDLKSGEVLDLGARPIPVPEEIPDPEQTGEERALVGPSTQLKVKTDAESLDESPDSLDTDIGTTTDGDIVITPLDPGTTTADDTGLDDSEHLIVSSYQEPNMVENSTIHIEDIIVTPYIEPIVENTPHDDSQEAIAPSV